MDKATKIMDPVLTVRQLIYLGVIETVRIRRQGFPIRRDWSDFAKAYDLLVSVPEGAGGEPGSDGRHQAVCTAIAEQFLDAESWQHSLPLKKVSTQKHLSSLAPNHGATSLPPANPCPATCAMFVLFPGSP